MKTEALGKWTAVCAFLALTTFPLLADNQTATAVKPDKTYTGKVEFVNPNAHSLVIKGFVFNRNFNLGADCTYVLWNKPQGTVGDLLPGQKVTVTYQDAHGVLVANRVEQVLLTREGTVKSIDPGTHTLALQLRAGVQTFQLPDDCKVMLHGGKSGAFTDIQPGNYVTITYETPKDKKVARQIAQTSETYTGQLTAVDIGDRVVKAKTSFGTKTFHLGNNCSIVNNGQINGQMADLKLGSRLSFTYDEVNGINVANRIGPVNAPSETATATQPETP